MTEEKHETVLDQFKPRHQSVVRRTMEPPRVRYFSNANCQGCFYKATSYCWNSCPTNVWAKRKET